MAESTAHKLVVADRLSRRYGRLQAVCDVSFTLDKGEVLGFLGPNGAGKSTTMQMLCGCLAPTEGGIRINGVDLLEDPLAAKRQIGFLPEQPPLYAELTVDEYLRYSARLRRVARSRLGAAVATVKERCGLTDSGRRLIGNLSKGYQQRVGIAQAIVHSPPVVILDEPTVGLDPIQIREIRDLIRTLGNDHGVILSTHILPEVQMTCNRVQIIHRGKLVFSDSIDNLNRQTQADSLLLALRNKPAVTELEAVDDVSEVETLPDGRFRIRFVPDRSPADRLVTLSVEHNWGLTELTPENRTLEQIFIMLTHADQSGEATT
ncbi:MAG TPA: ATP-binding cassette domain-containing protein [Gammaproteobacteria bacterium]